ncbi:MAG: translation elongation factor Ts [Bacteroidales bacterium]|jgi:elongation factor Ts|nr:translation elongation factor Ts [Bacteroidales bacterium]MDD4218427.1 translation elongation factor Ts [Bacteroidales bacterium]MDY0142220.1 translation elongation factor Ts [Bacteroidales bacterium]
MANISAADVAKLRKMTGAGMMDCKKALVEAEGNFERAKELIREKGLAIANKRADREASEGAVIAKTINNNTIGVMIALNCETDFVAKNDDFVALANTILEAAADKLPTSIEELKALEINGQTIGDLVIERSGLTGEKMEIANYEKLEAAQVAAYIHMGNKLATLVGLNKVVDPQIGMNIAMQVAAMNPAAVDKDFVSQEVIDKELEIGREQARLEGKAEELLDKIAQGKLQKFFKENTLLNQEFVQEGKISVRDYLKKQETGLTVVDFKRYGLSN